MTKTVGIQVNAAGTETDIADYLRGIAMQIEAGETRGAFPDGRSWEIEEHDVDRD